MSFGYSSIKIEEFEERGGPGTGTGEEKNNNTKPGRFIVICLSNKVVVNAARNIPGTVVKNICSYFY
jgi:hypothetical protein